MPLSLCWGKWVWEWLSKNCDAGGMWPCSSAGVSLFVLLRLSCHHTWSQFLTEWGLGFAQFVSCHEKLLLLRLNLDSCLLIVLVWVCHLVSPSQWGRGIRSHPAQSPQAAFPSTGEESCPAPGASQQDLGLSFPASWGWRALGAAARGVLGWKEGEGVMEHPGLCRWNIKPLTAVADTEMHMRRMTAGPRQVHTELSTCFGDLGVSPIYSQISALF